MGQYHYIVNIDKREYLNAHQMGDGIKLMEFGMSGDGGAMTGLALLLACSNGRGGGDFSLRGNVTPEVEKAVKLVGSWAGDRIAIVGDYAEEDDLPHGLPDARYIYMLCTRGKDAHERWANWQERMDDCQDAPGCEWMQDIKAGDLYADVSPSLRLLLTAGEGVTYTKEQYGYSRKWGTA